MRLISGLAVDSDHLDLLVSCLTGMRSLGVRPAILLADYAHPQAASLCRRLRGKDGDIRVTDLKITNRPGPYEWSDAVPQHESTRTVQLVTSWTLLSAALIAEFGEEHGVLLDRGPLPADATWLVVLRRTRLRIAAVLWPVGKNPTVYYGRTYKLAPPAREELGKAA